VFHVKLHANSCTVWHGGNWADSIFKESITVTTKYIDEGMFQIKEILTQQKK